jgi:hypothetical protein
MDQINGNRVARDLIYTSNMRCIMYRKAFCYSNIMQYNAPPQETIAIKHAYCKFKFPGSIALESEF